ncbi:MAG: hypothetical protein EOM26_03985 [Alphaproteobacteria bacterium]|nr:hypothetical protein [Alphaproteobacteria bacterium]
MGRTILVIIVIVLIAWAAMWALDIDVSGDAEMPRVDVEGGELPETEVDAADIDIEEERGTMTVPDVDVELQEEEFTYPEVDIEPPADDTATEDAPPRAP